MDRKSLLNKTNSPTGGNRIKKPCRSVEGRKPDCARDMKEKVLDQEIFNTIISSDGIYFYAKLFTGLTTPIDLKLVNMQ